MTEKKQKGGKFDIAQLGIKVGTPKTAANQKSFLIYGPPGSGKTRFAASASEVPALQRVLHIDLEAGSSSIENVYHDNIDVARPDTYEQVKDLLEYLLNEEHEYQTVIIDTVGKLMEFMEVVLDRKKSANAFEKWAALADDTLHWFETLHRAGGMTVIVLAHTESNKDERTGKVATVPYFLGRKTGREGPKIFDVIGYLYVDKHPETGDPLRVLQTEGFDEIVAKDRTDTLPVLLGAPDYEKVYGYIDSGVMGKGRDTSTDQK